MFRKLAVATAAAVILSGIVAAPSVASPPPGGEPDRLAVYTGTMGVDGLAAIVELGVDRHEVVTSPSEDAPGQIEVRGHPQRRSGCAARRGEGPPSRSKQPSAQRRSLDATRGVFRTYSGEGGIREELMAQAAANPQIAEFRVIGETVQGQEIGAVRLTKNVAQDRRTESALRPSTSGAQHAREWITPEMVRRLLDYYLDVVRDRPSGQGDHRQHRAVVRARRQPRRLRLHVHRGAEALAQEPSRQQRRRPDHRPADGVDLNRNYPTRWGYDNEGLVA